jgi:hypothetical protein
MHLAPCNASLSPFPPLHPGPAAAVPPPPPQVLYTTACAAPQPTGDGTFVPLQVNYQVRGLDTSPYRAAAAASGFDLQQCPEAGQHHCQAARGSGWVRPTPTHSSSPPLSHHPQEKFSAVGRTAGGYLKREGRPRDADVLVARLVDRPLRPMMDKGWCAETQVGGPPGGADWWCQEGPRRACTWRHHH